MRKLGSYLIGDMHVVLRNDMTVQEAHAIAISNRRKDDKRI